MTKWEYLSFDLRISALNDFHQQLNEFGELGWELVGMESIESKSIGLFDSGAATSIIVVVFKRPKE
ncbi:DUF4177 domain-containing protein [Fibrella forsythiae]|uniref:DUF4177 domain-containing protein n=1 Tax=Fibrella forsythiae TaxID=2817061 RepID=A0ABS3JDZ3_9BACT|nr:DUF4177 domain-containing protein [Fibrella forsythiae]MBO0948220.1 DUF4177 domain-containing protein [Fibrella forsythiae]